MRDMLYVCDDCTTVYAPAARCPHCGSTEYYIQGEEHVPKNTVHGGASHANDLKLETIDEASAVAVEDEPAPAAEPPQEPAGNVEATPAAETEPEAEPLAEPPAETPSRRLRR